MTDSLRPDDAPMDVSGASFGKLGPETYLLTLHDRDGHEEAFILDHEQMQALRDGVTHTLEDYERQWLPGGQ